MELASKFLLVLASSSLWLIGSGLVLWLCLRSRLRLLGRGALQYRRRVGPAGGKNRQRDGRHHEQHGRPGRRLAQNGGRPARAECSLAAHAAKSSRDVAALAVLQQNYDDEKEADDNVNSRDQIDHFLLLLTELLRWCGRGDLNPHAFRRHPLKMVCLPVPPLPHCA